MPDKVVVTWYRKDLETVDYALTEWIDQCETALKQPDCEGREEVEKGLVRAMDLHQHVIWILAGECDQTQVNLDFK
jgi:hypothetical protein